MDSTHLPQQQYRKAPVFNNLRKLMATGERRLEWVHKLIARGGGSEASMSFNRAEVPYHEAALQCLQMHQSLLRDEDSPIKALEDLLEELDERKLPEPGVKHDQLRRIVARARRIIQDFAAG